MPAVLLQPSTNYERQLLVDALGELGWRAGEDGDECLVQWCKARDADWHRVLRGEICASSLLVRTAVTRKVRAAACKELSDLFILCTSCAAQMPRPRMAQANLRVMLQAGLASLLKKAEFAPETFVIDLDDFDEARTGMRLLA